MSRAHSWRRTLRRDQMGRAGQARLAGLAGSHLHYDVNAPTVGALQDLLAPALLGVVDGHVGTEFGDEVTFFCRTGQRDDLSHPKALASWTRYSPTPPAAAWINTVSEGVGLAASLSSAHADSPCTTMLVAWAKSILREFEAPNLLLLWRIQRIHR